MESSNSYDELPHANIHPHATPQKNIKLVDIEIKDQHIALNVIVSFLGLAQKRGVFSFDESAKIFECIKMFQMTN
jgi:hypothetical protein